MSDLTRFRDHCRRMVGRPVQANIHLDDEQRALFRRLEWLPEDPVDQLSETYTELTLCDPCAGDLLLIAQGKAPRVRTSS